MPPFVNEGHDEADGDCKEEPQGSKDSYGEGNARMRQRCEQQHRDAQNNCPATRARCCFHLV